MIHFESSCTLWRCFGNGCFGQISMIQDIWLILRSQFYLHSAFHYTLCFKSVLRKMILYYLQESKPKHGKIMRSQTFMWSEVRKELFWHHNLFSFVSYWCGLRTVSQHMQRQHIFILTAILNIYTASISGTVLCNTDYICHS